MASDEIQHRFKVGPSSRCCFLLFKTSKPYRKIDRKKRNHAEKGMKVAEHAVEDALRLTL